MAGDRDPPGRRLPTNIPMEIVSDILLRLPLKSLCRFRCVSKPWLSLILNPHFTKLHFNRNMNTEKFILLSDHSLHSIETPPDGDPFALKLEFPNVVENPNPNKWTKICGSCDGLLLVADDSNNHFLLNPSTRDSKKLPKSSFYMRKLPKFIWTVGSIYGFGFDSSMNDYKVVRIFYYAEFQQFPKYIVSVYFMRTNSWKRVKSSEYDHILASGANHFRGAPSSGVFLNGFLHWFGVPPEGLSSDVTIVAFGLSNEKFNNVPMPDFVHIDHQAPPEFSELGVLRGCLCIFFSSLQEYTLDVIIMKEYGKRESWVRFTVSLGFHCMKPLRFSEEDILTIEFDRKTLLLYDLEGDVFSEVMIQDKPCKFEAVTYVESLISPGSDNEL